MRKKYRQKRTSNNYRSGLEEQIAQQLVKQNIDFEYESKVIKYTKPEKVHRYTPDFILFKKNAIKSVGRDTWISWS